jgi:tetratricopeptide (TPR) repeat protein
MTADNEYHSGPARELFDQLIERKKEPADLPSEVVALAIDSEYAPAILTVGTHEYLLGRVAEAMELLLSLAHLPPDTEDLAIIIDKAGNFLVAREDYPNALKLYETAAATFPDEPLFQAGLSLCRRK